jgi:hypothetical protein
MALAEAPATLLRIERGVAYVLFAYDAGLAIDLDQAERRVTAATARPGMPHKHRAPKHFEYRPAPLRVRYPIEPIDELLEWIIIALIALEIALPAIVRLTGAG